MNNTPPTIAMTVCSLQRQPLLLSALLGLVLATAPTLVRAVEAVPGRLRVTPAQKQKLFPEWRQLTLQATQRRIAILQKHQQCVSAASSLEALQTCQLQERQALINQRQQHRDAMRQLLQRNGITPPSRQGGSGWRMPASPEGVPMI